MDETEVESIATKAEQNITQQVTSLEKQHTRSHMKLSLMKLRFLHGGTNTLSFHVARACYLGILSFCGQLQTDAALGEQKKKKGVRDKEGNAH